ncbi:unnamed protein product [Caenorhabditis bovis]|uniref:Tetraspanin n=1 Tax=Caenorhabditis bovis TaxID=2654633 RepID=A0A8S1EGA0_9PELO|nr:unnamed protein product [Caenorhabditis bovis]
MRVDSDEYGTHLRATDESTPRRGIRRFLLGEQQQQRRHRKHDELARGSLRHAHGLHLTPNSRRKMGACVKTLRSLVFIFNFIFWISGIVIFALGLWLLLDSSASDFFALHSTHPGSFRIVGWLLIAAGGIMAFIGCFGCCGAWKLNQGALLAFFFVLMLVFFLELAAAITAYNKQEHIRNYIESSMYDTIRNRYASDTAYKTAFDTVQNEFQCCGVKSYSDWLGASWDRRGTAHLEEEEGRGRMEHGIGAVGGGRGNGYGRVPSSCCNDDGKSAYPSNCGVSFNQAPLSTYSQFIHENGCSDALYDRIYNHLDYIIAICVIVGSLQLLGMILAMALCCCVSKENKKYSNY